MTPEKFTKVFESIKPVVSDVKRTYKEKIWSHREQFLQRIECIRIDDSVIIRTKESYANLAKEAYDIAKEINIDLLAMAGETLDKKAMEYSMNGDRLWNFKPNYSFMNKDPLQNLNGYLRKHLASCMDMLDGRMDPMKDVVIDKFGAVYNYCILAVALIEDNNDFIKKVGFKGSTELASKDL
jgi:hypothetical protein